MNPTAIVDLVCAVFLIILCARNFSERSLSRSSRLLNKCLTVMVVTLLTDAAAYVFISPAYPFPLRYFITFLSIEAACVNVVFFTFYMEALFSENGNTDPWFFRVIKIVELFWTLASAYEYFSGHMVTYDVNGAVNADIAYPTYIVLLNLAIQFALVAATLINMRKIGKYMALMLSLFFVLPIIASVMAGYFGVDFAYASGAVMFCLVAESVQVKQTRQMLQEQTADRELATQQRYLKSFGDMVNAALWSIYINDSNEVTGVKWSDEVRHMLGSTAEEYPDKLEAWLERLHPDDKDRTIAAFNKGLDTDDTENNVYDLEYRLRKKSGEYCWYHALGRMEYNDDGSRKLYGIIYDLTAEKQLEEQQKQLQTAYDKLNESDRRSRLMHQAVQASMWSYSINAEDEVTGAYYDSFVGENTAVKNEDDPMSWVNALHPEDRERVFAEFMAAIRDHTCKTPYETTCRLKKPDGTFMWSKTSGRLSRNEDGTAELIGISINITEQMEEQQEQKKQLQEALSAAESANRAKTEFLFNMSHDVRTPMNAIIGFTNIAEKHIDDKEKVLDCLNKTKHSSSLLLSLINGVLDMSRIEHGSAELAENAGDVMLCFKSIEETLREEAERKDISLSFEFGEVADRFVYADFTRCLRVFTNLITNSIKYTRNGGRINVRCEQISPNKNGYALYRYTVADNGIGMSKDFQEHMFEAFAREHNSTTSGIQGTGLGLSVCKSFVDYMGGTIACESEPGKGTVFTVTLPFKVQKGTVYTDLLTGEVIDSASGASETVNAADFSNRRVLLVEDNELNREIALDVLEEAGMYVDEAENGSIAVEILKETGPDFYDFVLMDIQMPIMNGYEATKAIRKLYPDRRIPIIALSANAFEEDRMASKAAGMDDHVAKPINVQELFSCLAKYI